MAIHLARSRTGETGAMANLKKERKWRFHGRIENMKTFGFSNWCVWRVLEFEDKALHNMPQFSKIHNNTIWFPKEFIRRLRTCLGISRLLVPIFFFRVGVPKAWFSSWKWLVNWFEDTLLSSDSCDSLFWLFGTDVPIASEFPSLGGLCRSSHSYALEMMRRSGILSTVSAFKKYEEMYKNVPQHRVIELIEPHSLLSIESSRFVLWLLFSRLGATAESRIVRSIRNINSLSDKRKNQGHRTLTHKRLKRG